MSYTSTPCPSCVRLREERDEAIEAARQLRDIAFGAGFVPALSNLFSLTEGEAKCVAVMVAHPIARKAALMDALYFDDPEGGGGEKIIDVFICKARKKLQRHNVWIETVWGQGYKLSDEARARIKAMVSGGAK
jgi:DNA-binding response OmpR family regulator